MTCRPSFAPSSASAWPTRRFRSSDSTTHGPAMRNGAPPKCRPMSVVSAGEPGGALRLGDDCSDRALGPVLLARRPHEPGEQRVRPRGAGLELGVELTPDEPRVVG